MTHLQQAIHDAEEKGGYLIPSMCFDLKAVDANNNGHPQSELEQIEDWAIEQIVLGDPAFWQALGKARGWGEQRVKYEILEGGGGRSLYRNERRIAGIKPMGGGVIQETFYELQKEWEYRWHRLIDHLIAGKDMESFFKTL